MRPAFLCLSFRFVLYWRKTVGAKAVRRMLVKLNPCVISLMRVDFSIILNPKLFNTLSAHVIPLPKNFPKSPNLFLLQMIKYVNIM